MSFSEEVLSVKPERNQNDDAFQRIDLREYYQSKYNEILRLFFSFKKKWFNYKWTSNHVPQTLHSDCLIVHLIHSI